MSISEYAAGFEYEETERGISVTRVFHNDPNPGGLGGDTLPMIGDKFTAPDIDFGPMTLEDLDNCVVRSVSLRAFAGSPNVWEFIVNYTNEPSDKSIFVGGNTAVENLPKSLEFSGEFLNITPTSSDGWKWTSDDAEVKVPIPFRINSQSLRITRYVSDTNYSIFQQNVQNLTGHVNHADNPFGTTIGGGYGCWLFVGASTEPFRNGEDQKWWKADLQFAYRNPDETDLSGWSTLLKPNGTWDMPVNPTPVSGQDTLYLTADFSGLFDDSIMSLG